jgi:ATP-dependent helicase/nuclease subunit B
MKPALCVHNIEADRPFARTLAEWINAGYDTETLARLRVLLPNRRACRALREAFLGLSGGKPMLLPRIHPIGDWETEDLPPDLLSAEMLQHIPAAMDENRRLLLLTRLVMEFEKRRERVPHSAQAFQLARQLAHFLDEMTRENRDIFSLPQLAPTTELAEHWQQTIDFLSILSLHWPRLLQEEGVIDPIDRRSRILKIIAKIWLHTPPGYPIIAAGSTGTQPATAALLATIAQLPQGSVVLPGLDQDMKDSEWEMLEPSHPQYALKELLTHMKVARKDVLPITTNQHSPRGQCLRAVFQPAVATADWVSTDLPFDEGFHNIKLLVAETAADEARMIAIVLREALETPEKTAALVTPDRMLARRVVAEMQRFGIVIDDSGGTPLLDTPPGVYMRLVMEYVLSNASPVALLALLRHPLAALGRDPVECRSLSRILDKIYLRGVRPENGLTVLCRETKQENPALYALLSDLEKESKTLFDWMAGKKPIAASDMLTEHIRLTQWLATSKEESGEARLWAGDAGRQFAVSLAQLAPPLEVMPTIDPYSYPAFFEALFSDKVFRPRYGKHTRLSILSPLEARLQSFNRVILGSLNEAMWPASSAVDPWMSRPMRAAFGLPPLERTIGQSAHDVVQLMASTPEVFLTRAKKSEGKPTVASRWLVRLETLLASKDKMAFAQFSDATYYEQAKTTLDVPADIPPITRPEPKPPLAARPRRLSATKIEKWQRDPYIIYADTVLQLKKLPELDKEPDHLEFGNVVHESLKLFSDRFSQALPADPLAELLTCGKEKFDTLLQRPAVAALWWPRFEALAAWFLMQDRKRRAQGCTIITEREGNWPLEVNGQSFAFTTRIDRLEIDKEGHATLIDYKTGSLPENFEIKKGLAVQLPVEGLIALHGVCNPPLPRKVEIDTLEYWRLAGSAENCEIKRLEDKEMNAQILMEQCLHILKELARTCTDPEQPFAAETNAKLSPRYNDYEHLTRRKEWGEV